MGTTSYQESIKKILEYQERGKLVEAEGLCRQLLNQYPQPGVYQLLGLLNYALGRTAIALTFIQQALESNPKDAQCQSNLGAILLSAGRAEESAKACRVAIAIQGNHPQAYNNLGNALRQLGRLDEAVAAYRQALNQQPTLAEACNNLGNISNERGATVEAIAWYRRAIAARADYADAHYHLGAALAAMGRDLEATDSLRKALSLQPTHIESRLALANILRKLGNLAQAISTYQDVIAIHPDHAQAQNNLGAAFQEQGKLDQAMACYERAIRSQPAFAPAHNNAGVVLRLRGRLPEAIEKFRAALTLDPGFSQAANYLGTALREAGQIDESITVQQNAIFLWPENAQAHFNLAIALLLRGDFERGWNEYEWRQRLPGTAAPRQNIPCPPWRGETLSGQRILIHAEQGLGDFLQFVRYVPEIARRGGRVVLDCYPELSRLLKTIPGVERVTQPGEPLPPVDLHCPICSLPLAFRTTLQTIPDPVPYLTADPAAAQQWAARISSSASALNVGLVWAGRPAHHNDSARSIALSLLSPLAKIPGVRWFNLQKGPAAQQAVDTSLDFEMTDWTAELNDFADTAALLVNLDLLITVDTAAAHLAGALGKPVWLLLPYAPDFRWLLDRDDSPWYPTMRLFRQPSPGNWGPIISAVKNQLQQLAQRH